MKIKEFCCNDNFDLCAKVRIYPEGERGNLLFEGFATNVPKDLLEKNIGYMTTEDSYVVIELRKEFSLKETLFKKVKKDMDRYLETNDDIHLEHFRSSYKILEISELEDEYQKWKETNTVIPDAAEELTVSTLAGDITAYAEQFEKTKGISLMFTPKGTDTTVDLCLVRTDNPEHINIYVYGDEYSEDYTLKCCVDVKKYKESF